MLRRKIFLLMSCALITSAQAQSQMPSVQSQTESVVGILADTYGLQSVIPGARQLRYGTYWYVLQGRFLMPMPGKPTGNISKIYSLGDDRSFLVDENTQPAKGVNYARLETDLNGVLDALAKAREAKLNAEISATLGLTTEMDSQKESGNFGFNSPQFGPDDLWIEVLSVDITNNQVFLRLHNTTNSTYYQLESKTNLLQSGWTMGDIRPGEFDTNKTDFTPVSMLSSNLFFRGHQSDHVIGVYKDQIGVEPNGSDPGQPAKFVIASSVGITSSLSVYYRLSGTASNGVDYTNLTGVVTLPASPGYAEIEVAPIQDNFLEGDETVIMTLIQTNFYLIGSDAACAVNDILDASTTVYISSMVVDAYEPDGPPGIPALAASFSIYRSDLRNIYTNALTVFYQVSGTAGNGVDYSLLTGTVTLPANVYSTNLDVSPLGDNLIEGLETVTVTLIPTNTYLVDTNAMSGTATIRDTSTTIGISIGASMAIEPNGPPGAPAQAATFEVFRSDTRGLYPVMDVFYEVSGTASNGADYVLSGVAHFQAGINYSDFDLTPLADLVIEGPETVTATLIPNDSYLIYSDSTSNTVTITDSSTGVLIVTGANAVEPNPASNIPGQTGYFTVSRNDSRGIYSNLTVYYKINGTASNGVDYTNLTGTVTIAAGSYSTNIFVQPLADNFIEDEGDETVTLTLIATNGYYVFTNFSTATRLIIDNVATNIFEGAVPNVRGGPIGIDYHAPSNSLVISYDLTLGQPQPYTFARIYTNLSVSNSVVITNVIVITNWSGVHDLQDEVKLATVKSNAGGFTNGDMFFGSNTGIGWLSADATRSNLNWCILTNQVVTNALLLRGSLYVDQTGVFSNNLIAVTSPGSGIAGNKGVWRVDAQAHPTLITTIYTPHLEGVITLTNDPQKWGPWAEKIITGDEDAVDTNGVSRPLIYSIDTNGVVASYSLPTLVTSGIRPEDFDIIPPNQDLYASAFDLGEIVKLPASYLTNYVGDLLITDAGEFGSPARIFMVHWDATTTNFVTHSITFKRPDGGNGRFEHVTFAPINIPKR